MPKIVEIEAQRRMITKAAIAVINEVGLDGARLRDVARAANVTTGAVTHYFDNKDAVLEATLEEIVARTLGRMKGGAKNEPPPSVDAFIIRVCRYLPTDQAGREEWRVWLAFWGRAISAERLRAVHQRQYAAIVDRMCELLAPFRNATGAKAKRELRQCADALIAAIDGVGTRATLEPDLWPAKRQKETLTALLKPLLTAYIAAGKNSRPDAILE